MVFFDQSRTNYPYISSKKERDLTPNSKAQLVKVWSASEKLTTNFTVQMKPVADPKKREEKTKDRYSLIFKLWSCFLLIPISYYYN